MKLQPAKGALRLATAAIAVSSLMGSGIVFAQNDNADSQNSDSSKQDNTSQSTDLVQLQKDPSNWTMWSGQYNGQYPCSCGGIATRCSFCLFNFVA